jgi:Rrf2 family transcriptional regulator, nitric oxide-sensitive transcriptional repressor
MTISQTAEYALRAVVWLAGHVDTALGTPEIARATRVPAGYLAKVLQLLAKGGLVTSAPGRKGGFRLARPADAISILEVINAVDPVERIRRCPLGIESHGGALCPLHRRLDRAIGLMEQAFAEATIAELLAEPTVAAPLCPPEATPARNASGEAWLYGDFSASSRRAR